MTAMVITGDIEGKLQCPQDSHPDNPSISVYYIWKECEEILGYEIEKDGVLN